MNGLTAEGEEIPARVYCQCALVLMDTYPSYSCIPVDTAKSKEKVPQHHLDLLSLRTECFLSFE